MESQKTDLKRPVDAGPPPWIWFWLIMFSIYGMPTLMDRWSTAREMWELQVKTEAELRVLGAEPGGPGLMTFVGGHIMEALPTLVLVVALAAAMFSRIIGLRIEKRYRLQSMAGDLPEEVADLVGSYAPNLRIMGNRSRPSPIAFIYPRRFRESALALFGGFFQLCGSSSEAAKSVIIHEVAHYKRGDYQVIGLGNFLRTIITLGVFSLFLFSVLLVNTYWEQEQKSQAELSRAIAIAEEYNRLIEGQQELLRTAGVQVPPSLLDRMQPPARTSFGENFRRIYLPGFISTVTAYIFQLLSAVVIPAAAVITAELHADRYTVLQQGSAAGLQGALSHFSRTGNWWRWFLNRLISPPVSLRRWVLARGQGGLLLLLLFFPLAYLGRLPLLYGRAVAFYLFPASDRTWSEIGMLLQEHTKDFFVSDVSINSWAAMTVVLLTWPIICPFWERLFSGASSVMPRRNYSAYVIAAACTLCIAAVGLTLR